MGFKSGLSAGLFHQLSLLGAKSLDVVIRMHWVVILVESVPVWVVLPDEREKGGSQNITIFGGIHNPTEHHQAGAPFLEMPPHM